MREDSTRAACRLRQWRTENGLVLADVAGLTGLSVPFLSRIERGERQLRPVDRVRFARALGVPVVELFEPDVAVSDVGAAL